MWKGQWIVLVVSCAILASCVDGSKEASHATNQFSVDLLKRILQDKTDNVIISPVSIYTLLAIVQQGTGGNSRQELNGVLHAQPEETKEAYRDITTDYQREKYQSSHQSSDEDDSFEEEGPDITLEFATRAFVMSGYNVKEEFQQILKGDFHSSAESLDFTDTTASSEHINSWVSEGTHHRIKQLFTSESISPDSRLVLVNTIYFNSLWDKAFYGDNGNLSFSPRSGEEVIVPTLYQEELYPGGECSYLGAKYVHIKLKPGVDFSVLLVLPTERYGLDALMNRLTAENLTNMFSYRKEKYVTLQWPMFRLKTDTQLIPTLQKLGVNGIFQDSADLSGISTDHLKVTEIVQKAEIAVDESGVTASAASGTNIQLHVMDDMPEDIEKMEFIADHPFLFFIVDTKHNVPLFAGRVSNPSA